MSWVELVMMVYWEQNSCSLPWYSNEGLAQFWFRTNYMILLLCIVVHNFSIGKSETYKLLQIEEELHYKKGRNRKYYPPLWFQFQRQRQRQRQCQRQYQRQCQRQQGAPISSADHFGKDDRHGRRQWLSLVSSFVLHCRRLLLGELVIIENFLSYRIY